MVSVHDATTSPAEEDFTKEEGESQRTMSNDDSDDDMTNLCRILSRRQPLISTKEDPLDPIEWTVRKIIPIPAMYYWDYDPSSSINENTKTLGSDNDTASTTTTSERQDGDTCSPSNNNYWQSKLPWHLKAWHCAIYAAEISLAWTDRTVAQPIATVTGLNAPHFHYVTDHMTAEEWAAARRRLREQQQRQIVLTEDSETGLVMAVERESKRPISNHGGVTEPASDSIPREAR